MTTPAVTAAVAGAGLLHATWNAMAHRLTDRAVTFVLIGVADVVLTVPAVLLLPLPAAAAWPYLLTSVVMHVSYTLLLMRSYQLGDFTQMYPIARGLSPLVVGVLAVTVVGQHLGGLQLIGLAVVSTGLACVAFGGGGVHVGNRPALLAASATGLTIAAYTVLDGVGVRHAAGATGYTAWLFLLQGPALPLIIGARRGVRALARDCRPVLGQGLAAGTIGLAAYGIVIWAQTRADLASVAATRELAILFGAIIGRVLFRERFGAWRITGALLTVVGIAAINL